MPEEGHWGTYKINGMKEIAWSKLRLMNLSQIKAGECLKVTGDGELAFYLIIKPELWDYRIKNTIESLCNEISRGQK